MSSFLTKLKVEESTERKYDKFKPFQNERDSLGRLFKDSKSKFKRRKKKRSKLEESYKYLNTSKESPNVNKSESELINPGRMDMKLNKIFNLKMIIGKI